MARSEKQKLKLLYLLRFFREQTDEEHSVSVNDIISYLEANGISCERKTVYSDIAELRDFGVDIVSEVAGKHTGYKLASREFELAELKLLVDCVQSAKFITENKSRKLIKKLESLVSRYEAGQLHRQVIFQGRIKMMNESILYNVDKLHTAINENRRISFKYFQWNLDKQPQYKRNGELYTVSPWHLRWDDENYYLLAHDDASGKLKHYRVDKMKSIKVLEEPRLGREQMESFDLTAYTGKLFGMYGGEEKRVELECSNGIIGVMIDRFGKDIPVIKKDDDHFMTYVNVVVSPQFLGWVASLGGEVRVISPESVRSEMKKLSDTLHGQYSE